MTLHDEYYEKFGRFYIPVSILSQYSDTIPYCYCLKDFVISNAISRDFKQAGLLINTNYKNTFQSPLETRLGQSLYE